MFSFFKKKPPPEAPQPVGAPSDEASAVAPLPELRGDESASVETASPPSAGTDTESVQTDAETPSAPQSWLSRLGRWGGILPPAAPVPPPDATAAPSGSPAQPATPGAAPLSTASPAAPPTSGPGLRNEPMLPSPSAPLADAPQQTAPLKPSEPVSNARPPAQSPPASASPPQEEQARDVGSSASAPSGPDSAPATVAPIYPDATLRAFGARKSATDESPAEESNPTSRRDWFSKLKTGLRKTGVGLTQVFVAAQFGEELYEELEAALLQADTGVKATEYLIADLRKRVRRAGAREAAAVKPLLADALADLLSGLERSLGIGEFTPTVLMVVGVNGAGKTTTIGKLTRHLVNSRQKVMLAAADTFRAAAREQLAAWANRADLPDMQAGGRVDIVSQEGGDPAGVTFDAVVAGKARGCDVVIVDTAGRLTTQPHLMEELKKMRRVIGKAQEGAPHEVLLVLDGNTGQNALAQVQAFDAALQLTGLVVTKLDGTAKGGVLAAIALWARSRPTPLGVYFIGVGEKLEDLQTFDAREFANALLA